MSPAASTLRLTESQYNSIVAHCYAGFPDEACGLLIGPWGPDGRSSGVISQVWPCRNEAKSAVLYTVDGRDYLAASRAAEALGHEIVGVWHSHTRTEAYPSPTDVAQAVDPDWWYPIVSLRAEPVLHVYRIAAGTITESPVELDRD